MKTIQRQRLMRTGEELLLQWDDKSKKTRRFNEFSGSRYGCVEKSPAAH
jgi:hypothetical protein